MLKDGMKVADGAAMVLGCAQCGALVAQGQAHTCHIQVDEVEVDVSPNEATTYAQKQQTQEGG